MTVMRKAFVSSFLDSICLLQALELGTVVVGRLVPGRHSCRVRTLAPEADAPQEAEFALPTLSADGGWTRVARGPQHWVSYVQGVLQFFAEGPVSAASEGPASTASEPVAGPDPCARKQPYEQGLDLVVTSDVPIGGGLSSSAALEVATYTLLAHLYHEPGHVLICASASGS